MRVAFEPLLHLERQALHAAPHISMARRDPHPNAGWKSNHRAAKALITAVTSAAGAVAAHCLARAATCAANEAFLERHERDPGRGGPGTISESYVTEESRHGRPWLPSRRLRHIISPET